MLPRQSSHIYLLAFLQLALAACGYTYKDINADADGHAWMMYAGGNVSGADVQKNLGYGSISAQPSVEGSVGVGRNQLSLDWAHVDRSARGQAPTSFAFNGIVITGGSQFTSHSKFDLASATYGFGIGPKVFSVTPQIGAAYAADRTRASGTFAPVPPVPAVPFSEEQKDNSPFRRFPLS